MLLNLRRGGIFAILILLCFYVRPAAARETDCLTRDPSTIIRRGNEYWLYGTGRGIRQFSSRDRIHWKFRGPVFAKAPAWVADLAPRNRDNGAWAPDIHYFNGRYYLYFCYSSYGSIVSAIGVATNDTLDPGRWVDRGVVIHTTREDDFNALDPCIFLDAGGAPWLSFGSYWSGIKLIRIDPQTGLRSTTDRTVYSLARRQPPRTSIEGSCVYYHNGFYYLFVNWDGCCAGSRSTYNIRVGRSATVTGPYLDKDGKDMASGGGTLFAGSMTDNGTGAPFDDEVGPGHAAILHDRDGDWFSYHEEWARDHRGATTLNVNRLAWDSEGWPVLVLDEGPYKIVSSVVTHDVLSVNGRGDHAAVVTMPYEARASQKWTLRYRGGREYSILAGGGRALTLEGCRTAPGTKVEVERYRGLDCQKWRLTQGSDGAYTLQPAVPGASLALDVSGCSMLDGTPLDAWTPNGMVCQEFSFRIP